MKRETLPAFRVACCAAGRPAAVIHRGRRDAIRATLEEWEEAGRWWDGAAPARCCRVQTASGRVLELGAAAGEPWRVLRAPG